MKLHLNILKILTINNDIKGVLFIDYDGRYCCEDGSESVEESRSSDSEDGSTADSQVESDDECERESEDGSEESDRESSKSLEVERSREASAGTLCSLYCH